MFQYSSPPMPPSGSRFEGQPSLDPPEERTPRLFTVDFTAIVEAYTQEEASNIIRSILEKDVYIVDFTEYPQPSDY